MLRSIYATALRGWNELAFFRIRPQSYFGLRSVLTTLDQRALNTTPFSNSNKETPYRRINANFLPSFSKRSKGSPVESSVLHTWIKKNKNNSRRKVHNMCRTMCPKQCNWKQQQRQKERKESFSKTLSNIIFINIKSIDIAHLQFWNMHTRYDCAVLAS